MLKGRVAHLFGVWQQIGKFKPRPLLQDPSTLADLPLSHCESHKVEPGL